MRKFSTGRKGSTAVSRTPRWATASSKLTCGTRRLDIDSVGGCRVGRTCSRNAIHSLGPPLGRATVANFARGPRPSGRIHTPFCWQDYRRDIGWLCRAHRRLDGNIDSAEIAEPSEPKTNLSIFCLRRCCCYVRVHSRKVGTLRVSPYLDNARACDYGARWFIPCVLFQVVP
jgi:hypothetical protein